MKTSSLLTSTSIELEDGDDRYHRVSTSGCLMRSIPLEGMEMEMDDEDEEPTSPQNAKTINNYLEAYVLDVSHGRPTKEEMEERKRLARMISESLLSLDEDEEENDEKDVGEVGCAAATTAALYSADDYLYQNIMPWAASSVLCVACLPTFLLL